MHQLNLHSIVKIKARSRTAESGHTSWVSITLLTPDEDEIEIAVFSSHEMPKHSVWVALISQAINDAQAQYEASLVEARS